MSDQPDPFGLDKPFGERYYDKHRKGRTPTSVTFALYATKSMREAGQVAQTRFYVPAEVVKSILERAVKPGIRMMDLARACAEYAAKAGVMVLKQQRTSHKRARPPILRLSPPLESILNDDQD